MALTASSPSSATMVATATGWVMYGSPESRRCPWWALDASVCALRTMAKSSSGRPFSRMAMMPSTDSVGGGMIARAGFSTAAGTGSTNAGTGSTATGTGSTARAGAPEDAGSAGPAVTSSSGASSPVVGIINPERTVDGPIGTDYQWRTLVLSVADTRAQWRPLGHATQSRAWANYPGCSLCRTPLPLAPPARLSSRRPSSSASPC